MRKSTATLFLLATLSLGCLAVGAAPAMAEENVKNVNVVTEYGPYSYNLYEYPSYNTSFFFYNNSYVEFESVNGKFWSIQAPKFNLHKQLPNAFQSLMGFGRTYDSYEDFDVIFYAPDGKVIGKQTNARVSDSYSFPRDARGEEYENIRVRIESRGKQNIDAKFIVWEPVNPVVAQPIKKEK